MQFIEIREVQFDLTVLLVDYLLECSHLGLDVGQEVLSHSGYSLLHGQSELLGGFESLALYLLLDVNGAVSALHPESLLDTNGGHQYVLFLLAPQVGGQLAGKVVVQSVAPVALLVTGVYGPQRLEVVGDVSAYQLAQ